jgi:ABC-type oligopeptide transport system substrate-binding subunit
MKKFVQPLFLVIVMLPALLNGCAAAPIPAAPEPLSTNTFQFTNTIQSTNTPLPTNTLQPTSTLEPTALPGKVVLPLDSLQYGMPWLPLDKTKIPMVAYYGFNVTKPPFNVPEVRQAFAAALDTEVLTLIYERSTFYNNEKPTRTIIPPETLSRDVSGDIGIQYNPEKAKQFLAEAGYADPASFPGVTLLVLYFQNAEFPGIIVAAANEALRMWKENLGVVVNLEVKGVNDLVNEQRALIQSGKYDIFEHGVWANTNDPDFFVNSMFNPQANNNLTGFDDARITKLIADGEKEVDPAKRLPIYLEIERILSEEEIPIIPIFHCTVDGSKW